MDNTPPQTYHIYGRKSHPEPLAFVGELQASPDAARLKEQALHSFGEGDWVELVAFPRAAILRVIPAENSQ